MKEPRRDLPGLALGILLFQDVDELDGRKETDPFTMMLDGLDAESCRDVRLARARARAPNQDDIVSILQELAAMELAHERFVSIVAGKIEAIEIPVGRESDSFELVTR